MGGDPKMMGGGQASGMPRMGGGQTNGMPMQAPPGIQGGPAPMGGLADMFRSILGSGGQMGGAPIATQPTGPEMPPMQAPPMARMPQQPPQEAPKWGPRDQWVRESNQLAQIGMYGQPDRDINRFKMENPSLFSEAPPRPTGMGDAITGSVSPKFPSQSQLLAEAINARYR